VFGSTPAERSTTRTPIALSGTWFGRVGLRPYELLGLTEPTTTSSVTPPMGYRDSLPVRGLAA